MTKLEANRRPLRVVHVTWGLSVGGLEKLLVEIARHADPRQVALRFVSLSTRGQLADAIEACGWPVTAMEEPEGLRPGLIARLAWLFRRWRADVVHTHNTKALVYGGPAARLAGATRLIHTWHGQNLVGSRREGLLFRMLGRLPDQVVAVSRDAGQLMIREGIPPKKVRVIWNGIDTQRFAFTGPQPAGPVVSVARLSPEKDLQTLVRAMALAQQEEPGLRLEIAGEGACRSDLQRLAADLGLNGHVRFLGPVQDVPGLLRQAGLFVLPSLTEGISLTLLEASASGLPVVATNVGGNPEIIQNGVSGLLVPVQAPAALASSIVRLYRDPQQRVELGTAARRRVEANFDIRRMVRAYENLYREPNSTYSPALSFRTGLQVQNGESSAPPTNESRTTLKPRVITNFPKLAGQNDVLRCEVIAKQNDGFRKALRLWRGGQVKDAIVLDQDYETLVWLCLLRLLSPYSRPPLVSLDLVLGRPGRSWLERFKGVLKRIILSQVDLFLMHMKERKALREAYGIAPHKVSYVPFKVNLIEQLAAVQSHEGDYVFTGGRSRRDYQTFCTALADLNYPARIVTPRPEVTVQHGTSLDGIKLPKNVQLLHDDGSFESWVSQIARCKVAVFCILPESLSPSGVGAYLLAMALKKCVIISDCPSTRNILIDGENAILMPMQDPVALRDALCRAWEDDAYRRRIAEGGYRYAMSLGGEDTLARNVAAAVVKFLRQRRENA